MLVLGVKNFFVQLSETESFSGSVPAVLYFVLCVYGNNDKGCNHFAYRGRKPYSFSFEQYRKNDEAGGKQYEAAEEGDDCSVFGPFDTLKVAY